MSGTAWQYMREPDGTGVLTLDVPGRSANTLSGAVLIELETLLGQIEADPPSGLLIRSGKPGGFVAGADVHEFTTFRSEADALTMIRRGQRICDRIEALPCPSVALLQGFALGGGLELALACHYRIGVDDGRLALGLPEVQLGIHPGFGGTVRSVRLLGVRAAMDLMLTGRTLRSERAAAIGLIDQRVPLAEAEAACRDLLRRRPARHRPAFLDRLLSLLPLRRFVVPGLLRQVTRRVRRDHYPAPFAIIELWARHGAAGAAAYEAEALSIARLFQTPTAHNLVRVFQLQDRLKALGGRGAAGSAPRHVHVVGAGVMGGDIAAWCALRGFEVTLQDRSDAVVAPALARAGELFGKRCRDAAERDATLARLRGDVAGDGVATADVVIEAIFEDLQAKRALYAALEPRLKPGALLATNTSSIRLEALAEGLADPGRLVGLHFFNPVAQMPLVEIVRGTQTTEAVLGAGLAFARRLDKLPLPCRSAPGFVVNRVLMPYLQEAMLAVEEGATPEQVDAVAVAFGMPMGPLELADTVGLDVCRRVGEIVAEGLHRARPQGFARLDSLVAAGQLGRKTGRGYYEWVDGKARRAATPAKPAPADLEDRLILVLVNECVACLREAVAADADLIDAGVIFGAGFAPFRGGPLHWARDVGAAQLQQRLVRLESLYGTRFTPDAGWSGLA